MTRASLHRPPLALGARRARRGFTLIEVMVAATFFMVSVAGMVTGISIATRQYEHQRHTTAALAILDSVMETLILKQSGDSDITAGNHSAFYDDDGIPQTTAATYTASWVVTGGVPIEGMREIRLTVSWQEASGMRSITMRTVRP